MPKQVIPFTGFDQVGVIKDTPPVALPPNAFSDCRNIRFKDGAVRKMEGEVNIFPNLFDTGTVSYDESTLKYIVWWPNPNLVDSNQGYYLIIKEETRNDAQVDVAYLAAPGDTALSQKGIFSIDPTNSFSWQHTFFQGGFAIVINNGIDAPHYILDEDGNESINDVPDFAELPGWQSYNVNDVTISDTFFQATDLPEFILPEAVDFTTHRIIVTLNSFPITVTAADTDFSDVRYTESGEEPRIVILSSRLGVQAQVTIQVQQLSPVVVRAGVIRSFGDFLVAGNLIERDETTDAVVRNLAGIVRTSDVAAPGSIPNNWNPFAGGVSTADEFILTATGVVQDMAELQGSLYIYANNAISVMRQTGNAQIPLAVTPVTESYGAQTTNAVLEFDGRHFIVGSQDIYLFAGHPGSIKSVSDQRVRRYFFDRLNPLHNQRLFTLRYTQRDEIWICYPTTASLQGECDEALIWNYRQDVWTIRDLTAVVAGDVGPLPGGGLPTSSSSFSGNSGDNGEISGGIPTVHTIAFDGTDPINISNEHSGVASEFNIEVNNLPDFESSASSFVLTFGEDFDSGPTSGVDSTGDTLDDVDHDTAAVNVTVQLLNSSVMDSSVTVALPRFLTVDKNWSADQIYFSGVGVEGDADYYPGQRVIDDNAGGTPTVYRVLPRGDGSLPGHFYAPDELGDMFGDESEQRYQDAFDLTGVRPRDLVTGATYGTVPGDGGSGNAVSALQARWESLGPVSTHGWTVADVATMVQESLEADSGFTTYFETQKLDVTDGNLIIEAREDSGVGTFPTYDGVSIEFSFPDLNNALNSPEDTNGGNITDLGQAVNPNPGVAQGGSLLIGLEVRERSYLPFDEENPTTTGRYAETGGDNPILDRVIVGFNESFSGSSINEDIAALIREGVERDPTGFWTVSGVDNNINLVSVVPGNYAVTLTVTPPTGVAISQENNFTLTETAGARATTGDNSITPDLPRFLVTPPGGDMERPAGYFAPVSAATSTSRGEILDAILDEAVMVYTNWEVTNSDDTTVTLTTIDDDSDELPASLRQADRPVQGTWTVTEVAPGNTINVGVSQGIPTGTSQEMTTGRFSLASTPSYLGILVSNPTTPSGLEFLVLEAGDPDAVSVQDAINSWIPTIQNSIPRISLLARTGGFFLQPANYDNLANFVLTVRVNDTPANAEWIYRLATDRVNIDDPAIQAFDNYDDVPEEMRVTINSGSNVPLFINGAEEDNVYDADNIPAPTDTTYLRSGGPLKVAQSSGSLATLRLTNETTLIFDIFRPWPKNEVNFNLEYPILANVFLSQDEGGVFRRLNKITGADVGWSKPMYLFAPRTTTEDLTNFTEMVDPDTDDFPMSYTSYIERVQLALTPEFDTEELVSIALWADGTTPEFLRGTQLYNQLDIQVQNTNYPGEITSFSGEIASDNKFNVSDDYKADMRVHGRFLNYRITDGSEIDPEGTDITLSHQAQWNVSGMQAEIMKGGKR